jgi:hypothetical protein
MRSSINAGTIMSSGAHLKLCLINALLNTFTPLKGEEVQKGGGGGECCGVMKDGTIITVQT